VCDTGTGATPVVCFFSDPGFVQTISHTITLTHSLNHIPFSSLSYCVADQLNELNNLNGVMEVISGLSSSGKLRTHSVLYPQPAPTLYAVR
jgi:hypothetical protein